MELGGVKNLQRAGKTKRTSDSYRVPLGWSFLEPTRRIVLVSSLSLFLSAHKGSVVTKKKEGATTWGAMDLFLFAPLASEHLGHARTHSVVFPNLVDF